MLGLADEVLASAEIDPTAARGSATAITSGLSTTLARRRFEGRSWSIMSRPFHSTVAVDVTGSGSFIDRSSFRCGRSASGAGQRASRAGTRHHSGRFR
jgi:hypothetical protein